VQPHHTIHRDRGHLGWDRSIQPVLRVAPGSTVEVDCQDASGGQLGPDATAAHLAGLASDAINPLTGPVFVEGAEPGDTLAVHIDGLEGEGWGWTAIIPGFGLLAAEFPEPFVNVSTYDAGGVAFADGIRLPLRAFTGTIGVAPAAAGRHDVVPPRHVGGNLDLRDVVAGATLYLPVEVPGALLSIGDTHAAQGDGEVCGTAVETAMRVTVTVDVRRDLHVRRPQLDVALGGGQANVHHVTTGVGPDLYAAARQVVMDQIDYLARTYGLDPQLAYCLCSVAGHLRISEVVDAPNWVVACYLPTDVFVD